MGQLSISAKEVVLKMAQEGKGKADGKAKGKEEKEGKGKKEKKEGQTLWKAREKNPIIKIEGCACRSAQWSTRYTLGPVRDTYWAPDARVG